MRPKIAVDVQFGPSEIASLEAAGFEVVVRAGMGEMDSLWLERAARHGAHMICSPDSDVEIWCYDRNIRYCKVPGSRRVDLVALVIRRYDAYVLRETKKRGVTP